MIDNSRQKKATNKPFPNGIYAEGVLLLFLLSILRELFIYFGTHSITAAELLIRAFTTPLLPIVFFSVFLLFKKHSLPSRLGATTAKLFLTIILAICILFYINNLLWSIFEFHIFKERGEYIRALWLMLILVIGFFCFILVSKIENLIKKEDVCKKVVYVDFFLIISGFLILIISVVFYNNQYDDVLDIKSMRSDNKKIYASVDRLPNILMLNGDGIVSRHMSFYGYKRQTTPFLDSIKQESLSFYNHYANSNRTSASYISLIQSKPPPESALKTIGNVLKNEDRYENLPWFLNELGYVSGDFGIRLLTDPRDLAIDHAFSFGNGRNLSSFPYVNSKFVDRYFYHTYRSASGVIDVLLTLTNYLLFEVYPLWPFVAEDKSFYVYDRARVDQLKEFIETVSGNKQPFFAHLHLMGSHGDMYFFEEPFFSKGRERQLSRKDDDYYDDAILQFDRYVEEIYQFLEAKDLIQDTLVIINSDHGRWHTSDTAIPLILKFPGGNRKGEVFLPSQRIDIAPTVIDYLGFEKPPWAKGVSLLENDPDRMVRKTFIAGGGRINAKNDKDLIIDRWAVIQCQRYIQVRSRGGELNIKVKPVTPYWGEPCPDSGIVTPEDIVKDGVRYLDSVGYDMSDLRLPD